MGLFGDDFEKTIKRFEGYAPRASWDYQQHTNGWGTRARFPGETIDPAEAQQRLNAELSKAHDAVRSFAPNIDAGTAKALTDLTFNAGTKWQSSGLGAAVKAGDLDKARGLFQQYVKAGGETLPGLVERRKVGAGWIGAGGDTQTDGQQPMRQPFPWMGLQWPRDDGSVIGSGETNPGLAGGALVRPRSGPQGMFDTAMPPETAPEMQAPPIPPPRGPQGPMGSPMGMGGGNVSRETSSEQGPGFIQRMSMNPLVMGGIMMALDASRGGSGIDGFKNGAGSASGIQDAYMKNWQLQQKMQQEKAVQSLLSDPSLAENVPPEVLKIAQATKDPSPVLKYVAESEHTKNIQEFKFMQKNGFKGTFEQFLQTKPNSSIKHGLVPIPYQKPDGTTGYMVSNTAGDTKDLSVPGGGKILTPASTYQTATEVITRDKLGNELKRESKGVGEAERQKAVGEAQGKAQVDLPSVEKHAQTLTKLIEAVETDPYLPKMVGAYGGRAPNFSEAAKNTQAKIDQLKGQAFVQAFKEMKGAGAITEQEGLKASQALTRLQEQIVSNQDYRAALVEFKDEVIALRNLKRTQARGSGSANGGWSIQRVE